MLLDIYLGIYSGFYLRVYLRIYRSIYTQIDFEICSQTYLDISQSINLNKILDKCKINQENFHNGIKDLKIKNELKELTNKAFKLDVFGAPTFLINDKLFWGQDRLAYALEEYIS